MVAALLAKGADINAVDEDGWTALYRACYNSEAASALFLIEAGADVNMGDEKPLGLTEVDKPEMAAVKAALLARGARKA